MPVSYTHAKEKARSRKSYSVGLIFIVASKLYVVLPYSSLANDLFDRMRVFEPLWDISGNNRYCRYIVMKPAPCRTCTHNTQGKGKTQTKRGTHIWTFTHVRERYDLLASEWCGHFFLTFLL